MAGVLSHEEFEELMKEEYGDLLPHPGLVQAFDPEDVFAKGFDWDEPNPSALRLLMLNVAEVTMYTDRKGKVIVIVPSAPVTYDMVNGFFPVKNAWLYTLSGMLGADLDDRTYLFRHGKNEHEGNVPLPRFDINDMATH